MSPPEVQIPVAPARRFARPAPPAARRTASVLGLGTALPAGSVRNEAVEERLGKEAGWVERRTGIRARRRLAGGETLVGLTATACRNAMNDAGVAHEDIDLVVAGTTGSDEILPHLAPLVAAELGIRGVAAFDVGAACTGFLTAISVASGTLESGRSDRALVIGADAMARWTDPDDGMTAALFGDGAGAVILGATDDPSGGGIGPIALHSDGRLGDIVWISRSRGRIEMDGQATYRHAITAMRDATHEAVALAGLELADIDLFVYHQANRRILVSLTERLGVDPAKVVDAIAYVGNTSAGSLPLALAQARSDGQLRRGSRVLLGAAGSGFCWGAGVLTW